MVTILIYLNTVYGNLKWKVKSFSLLFNRIKITFDKTKFFTIQSQFKTNLEH